MPGLRISFNVYTTFSTLEMNKSIFGVVIFKAIEAIRRNGVLLSKLFWPTVRKNCSSDREKNLKFEAEGQEFAKVLRLLEKFIQTVKGQINFW